MELKPKQKAKRLSCINGEETTSGRSSMSRNKARTHSRATKTSPHQHASGWKRLIPWKKSSESAALSPLLPENTVSSSSSKKNTNPEPTTGRKVLVSVVVEQGPVSHVASSKQDPPGFSAGEQDKGSLNNSYAGRSLDETLNDSQGSHRTQTDPALSTEFRRKAILKRPFGRNDLPPRHGGNWVVEVSPAEWDSDELRWKYRILVQRRTLQDKLVFENETPASFTAAFTWRSVSDFVWLEQALRAEYHGSLLLPLLSVYLGTTDVANFTQSEVDPIVLRDWLGDVLNGIRGHGEVILPQDVSIISCEAMEAFLYRNTDPLHAVFPVSNGRNPSSMLDDPWRTSPKKNLAFDTDESFVQSLWAKPLSCLPIEGLCDNGAATSPKQSLTPDPKRLLPLEMISCSSRALEGAVSLEVQDSFAAMEPEAPSPSMVTMHSQLIESERELILSYRKTSMLAMDKLRALLDSENDLGLAWKRFAASLSNLYCYEKDLTNVRLYELKGKEIKATHRKLGKKNVEDLLKNITEKKTDRSTVSLRALDSMMGAYIGDLSSVEPAIMAHSDAIVQLTHIDEERSRSHSPLDQSESDARRHDSSWIRVKSVASTLFSDIAKHMKGESFNSKTALAISSTERASPPLQRKEFEKRLVENERRFQTNMITLCRVTHTRAARMAWRLLTMESAQVTELNSAAHSLRTKINIIDREKFAIMIARHKKEVAEDDVTELDLVHRIVNIGQNRKFSSSFAQISSGDSEHQLGGNFGGTRKASELQFEVLGSLIKETADTNGALRDEAVALAKERLGRWDARVALAIMRAVGSGADSEVRVEETTRDLRLVRKYAIGLRENLALCVEAAETLQSTLRYPDSETERKSVSDVSSEPPRHMHDTRWAFIDGLCDVLSGTFLDNESPKRTNSASASKSILSGVGLNLNDPAGWRLLPNQKSLSCNCRDKLQSYAAVKDLRTEELVTKLLEHFNSYRRRLEGIESYVYMGCVGIQLEKFYSQLRSEALAAFEQKTDINTAINIATRKRLPLLVSELEAKLEKVPNVTHTSVKELKEMHLQSKMLKNELSQLASRRFLRAREASTEPLVELMTEWAQHEEQTASIESNALGEAIQEVERAFSQMDIADSLPSGGHKKV